MLIISEIRGKDLENRFLPQFFLLIFCTFYVQNVLGKCRNLLSIFSGNVDLINTTWACEGEKPEPDYFKAFRMTAAIVKAVGQAMNTMTLVSKAMSIRDEDRKKSKNSSSMRLRNRRWRMVLSCMAVISSRNRS